MSARRQGPHQHASPMAGLDRAVKDVSHSDSRMIIENDLLAREIGPRWCIMMVTSLSGGLGCIGIPMTTRGIWFR
jgi:hypothetical protein